MYLIESDTLALKWFPASRPPYAILSHTWGPEEVTFAEFQSPSRRENSAGFQKIKSTCAQACQDGLGYVWVDTCCINKESSAELGEAINSMFRWYREAKICYAYIEDLSANTTLPIRDSTVLKGCRWFSRGWTLQELLAPYDIDFFGAQWNKIGKKRDLSEVLEQITAIPQKVLRQETLLQGISVADRMSWAAGRQTSREEDIAYCLMGLFDVNMPMIYGEGCKAFLRLQDEIVKQTRDDSLFAWRANEQSASELPYRGLFASSPSEFASDTSIVPFRISSAGSTDIISGGRISLNCTVYRYDGKVVLGLKCFQGTDLSRMVGIEVVGTGANNFLRARPSKLHRCSHKHNPAFEDFILERFSERKEVPKLDDIYHNGVVRLADLPQEIEVSAFHSKTFPGSKETRVVPLVFLFDEKIAFELHVDSEASGVHQCAEIGRSERLSSPAGSSIRVFAVLWAERAWPSASYEYHYSLEKLTPEETPAKLFDASRPLATIGQQQVEVGWAVIDIRGSLEIINEQSMFSVDIGFTVNRSLEAEVKDEWKKQQGLRLEKKRKQDHKRDLLVAWTIMPVAIVLLGGTISMVVIGAIGISKRWVSSSIGLVLLMLGSFGILVALILGFWASCYIENLWRARD